MRKNKTDIQQSTWIYNKNSSYWIKWCNTGALSNEFFQRVNRANRWRFNLVMWPLTNCFTVWKLWEQTTNQSLKIPEQSKTVFQPSFDQGHREIWITAPSFRFLQAEVPSSVGKVSHHFPFSIFETLVWTDYTFAVVHSLRWSFNVNVLSPQKVTRNNKKTNTDMY